MGVYIPKMEMPEECRGCPFEMYYFACGETRCRATNKILANNYDVISFDGRPEWCPLIDVPPHGRLGDLDKLEKMFADIDSAPYSCFDGEEPFYSAEDAAQIIRLAPTIIQASERKE